MNKILKKIAVLLILFSHNFLDASLTPYQVVEFLTQPPFNLQQWLQQRLYFQTNTLSNRPLYTLPSLSFTGFPINTGFTATFFYNGTPYGMYFNEENETRLTAAINASSLTFEGSQDLLDLLFEQITVLNHINFSLFGDLFDNIIVQEHRLGGMFQYALTTENSWFFLARMPLLYQIHNVFLEPEIQDRFADELAIPFTVFGVESDRKAVETFIKKTMVSDSIGLGELQCMVGKQFKTECSTISPSLELVIPTTCAFKNGLIGGDFSDISQEFPYFSLYKMINLVVSGIDPNTAAPDQSVDQGMAYFTTLFSEMLRRITAGVYDIPTGQKSFGIGGNTGIEKCVSSFQSVGFFGRALYQIPKTIRRFAYVNTPAEEFNRNYLNPALGTENLTFFSNEFLYRLILVPLEVKVHPGLQVQAQLYTTLYTSESSVTIGCDGWWQKAESLLSHNSIFPPLQNSSYPVLSHQDQKAQCKLFANGKKIFSISDHDLEVGLLTDVTIASYGIGKDITFALSLSSSF